MQELQLMCQQYLLGKKFKMLNTVYHRNERLVCDCYYCLTFVCKQHKQQQVLI